MLSIELLNMFVFIVCRCIAPPFDYCSSKIGLGISTKQIHLNITKYVSFFFLCPTHKTKWKCNKFQWLMFNLNKIVFAWIRWHSKRSSRCSSSFFSPTSHSILHCPNAVQTHIFRSQNQLSWFEYELAYGEKEEWQMDGLKGECRSKSRQKRRENEKDSAIKGRKRAGQQNQNTNETPFSRLAELELRKRLKKIQSKLTGRNF